MPLWLQLVIIFIVSISGIVFHLFLMKKIRVWAINDQINALSGDDSDKKHHLEQVYQQLLTDKVPHKQHHDKLEAAAKAFDH
ncbi:hypothetical protein [Oceanospirillum sediminis]|uniref:Uncharacterized protein n=1 Tax=Oceanospirillum sediminis TaxID=2760088 RepID=A0A839IR27_9GAMM|nr:hypothetical protein [Oceanospirillum sediminis]MBB1486949.1 hypothetical protein [Oceanospirillum sediminis]